MSSMFGKTKIAVLGLVAVGLLAVVGCTTDNGATPGGNSDAGGTIFSVANSAEIVDARAGLTPQVGGGGDNGQLVNYVNVAGRSEIQVVPDRANLSLSITAKEDTVAEATEMAGSVQARVLTAARAIDGAEDFSSTLSIRQDFVYDRSQERNVPDGFTATYSINFSIVDDDDVGAVAGDAVAAVVNAGGDLLRLNSVNFNLDDRTAVEATARRNAAANARSRAGDYATGLNVSLGDVLAISEVGGSVQPVFGRTADLQSFSDEAFAAVPSFEFAAGLVTISASVQVSFAIEN